MSTHTPADTRAFQMTKKTENELQQFLLGDLSVTQVVYGVSRACSGLDIRGICTHTHTHKKCVSSSKDHFFFLSHLALNKFSKQSSKAR